jgi:hypothetical protein
LVCPRVMRVVTVLGGPLRHRRHATTTTRTVTRQPRTSFLTGAPRLGHRRPHTGLLHHGGRTRALLESGGVRGPGHARPTYFLLGQPSPGLRDLPRDLPWVLRSRAIRSCRRGGRQGCRCGGRRIAYKRPTPTTRPTVNPPTRFTRPSDSRAGARRIRPQKVTSNWTITINGGLLACVSSSSRGKIAHVPPEGPQPELACSCGGSPPRGLRSGETRRLQGDSVEGCAQTDGSSGVARLGVGDHGGTDKHQFRGPLA